MTQYLVKEFKGFTASTALDNGNEDNSVEDWLTEQIRDNQKNGYSVESVCQSMVSINDTIYRSIILIMSK